MYSTVLHCAVHGKSGGRKGREPYGQRDLRRSQRYREMPGQEVARSLVHAWPDACHSEMRAACLRTTLLSTALQHYPDLCLRYGDGTR